VLAKYKLANFGRTRGQIALGETIFSKIIVIFGRIHRRSVFGFIFFKRSKICSLTVHLHLNRFSVSDFVCLQRDVGSVTLAARRCTQCAF